MLWEGIGEILEHEQKQHDCFQKVERCLNERRGEEAGNHEACLHMIQQPFRAVMEIVEPNGAKLMREII